MSGLFTFRPPATRKYGRHTSTTWKPVTLLGRNACFPGAGLVNPFHEVAHGPQIRTHARAVAGG